MIPKETIDKIFETARIEDVVGDFVTLKKRGVNLLGLCPFHNEKTPSFTVSPAKGIYKCFGCAKGGNSVNFIMDHEQMTYPEALKYLAKKYNIEIEEKELSVEDMQAQNEKESLYVVSSFAQKYFTEQLHTTDEGKSIGLGYFKERGFRNDIIEKFQLGYSPDQWRALTDAAITAGYQLDYLIKAGLTIKNETSEFDRFKGRVMFPIHSVSGRVIAFGGRILKTDKKTSKYVNSPETEIYSKSKVLYGIFFGKKSITELDNCFLVEGYTDVISMHQAGIENVVASSGTSLTTEQIRLIRRYTNNITILYDGDAAGIKASFRGIDMILEEGMNVKVLLFPDGEDPDSYSKRVSSDELKTFIKSNSKDFISFKTKLLYKDTENDPIKRAELIKDIVISIAGIPEAISRSVYIKECSKIMQMEEQVLLNELNKQIRKKLNDRSKQQPTETSIDEANLAPPEIEKALSEIFTGDSEPQEKDIIRLLLNYGRQQFMEEQEDAEGNKTEVPVTIAEFILGELQADNLQFDNPVYQQIYGEFTTNLQNIIANENYFNNHDNDAVRQIAIDLVSSPYTLSDNWEKQHGILVQTEGMAAKKAALTASYALKAKRLMKMLSESQEKIKESSSEEEIIELMKYQSQLIEAKKQFNALLGRIIIK